MWDMLFLDGPQALSVVLGTAGIYWAFVIGVRLLGQRALARMSSTDLATTVALGAVIGRAALGYTPTFGAGVLALLTLFAMQAVGGQLRQRLRRYHLVNNPPLLIMAGSEVLLNNLRKAHLAEEELWPALRLAGIRSRSEVACVILEPTGDISVLQAGATLEKNLMSDVRGIEYLPEEFFRRDA